MIGTFTTVLREPIVQEALAARRVEIMGSTCDLRWWKKYYDDLCIFKELRNKCCHTELFEWDDKE